MKAGCPISKLRTHSYRWIIGFKSNRKEKEADSYRYPVTGTAMEPISTVSNSVSISKIGKGTPALESSQIHLCICMGYMYVASRLALQIYSCRSPHPSRVLSRQPINRIFFIIVTRSIVGGSWSDQRIKTIAIDTELVWHMSPMGTKNTSTYICIVLK